MRGAARRAQHTFNHEQHEDEAAPRNSTAFWVAGVKLIERYATLGRSERVAARARARRAACGALLLLCCALRLPVYSKTRNRYCIAVYERKMRIKYLQRGGGEGQGGASGRTTAEPRGGEQGRPGRVKGGRPPGAPSGSEIRF